MLLINRNWCSNCQSSECPCLQDVSDEIEQDEDEILDYFSFIMKQEEEQENEEDPKELEKAIWIAENKQLNNNL